MVGERLCFGMKKFWNVIKNSDTAAELLIYGEISDTLYWGDEVTPKDVNDMLNAIGDVSEIILRINSPGGDIFAGMSIYWMLKRHPAKVTAYVDGLAASISSVIPLAADSITMGKGTMMMIHRPMAGIRLANSDELRKNADILDKIEDEMIDLYSKKMGKGIDEIKALLAAETWYTADEAKAAGLIDKVEGSMKMVAHISGKTTFINGIEMDLTRFQNAPTIAPESPDPEVNDDDEGGPLFDVGDDVQITIAPRVAGQSGGVVREAMLTYVYGILFDGDEQIYHWYTESELKELPEGTEPPEPNEPTQNKQQAQGRNLDLELKSLALINTF